jgi:hypothetical protein
MRRVLLHAAALVGLIGCEQRFSADPPAGPESFAPAPSSSNALDALLATSATDAGAAGRDTSHALVVTLCSASPQACPAPEGDASTDGSYHVVFGSGRGAIRSRGQAMADLYKELRDRTKSGEHLDAEPRAPGGVGSPARLAGGSTSKASEDSSDPIAQCASHLLDIVDGVGEVGLDVVHSFGSTGCVVSLGRSAADGGASQCLIKAPERVHRPGR